MARVLMFMDAHGCGCVYPWIWEPYGSCALMDLGLLGHGCPLPRVLGVGSLWEWKDMETS